MDIVQERAYAKLNLTLGVLFKRMDGYHALDSLMQTIDLADTITIEKDAQVTVTNTGIQLPYNNTMRRAAIAYQAYTGKGARIRAIKRIPAEAGMGGASADAAAVLRGMQLIYGELDDASLMEIALSVGADVPFMMRGGLARAEGIGEQLTPLRSCPMYFVIAKPEAGISTRELYYGLNLPRPQPDTAGAIGAIAAGDLPKLGSLLFNALEEPAASIVPEIASLHKKLIDAGALGAAMTGSGSTVFGLFPDFPSAKIGLKAVEGCAFARVCRTQG